METIVVKSIKRVGKMLIVGVNGNREATMNSGWQSQEMDFIEKDVGEGGNFQGELQQKGQYLNITKVDMSSANKATGNDVATEVIKETPQETKGSPNPQRVGLFIKLAVEMMVAAPIEGKNVEENLCENIQEIKKLEEFVVKLLE